jgi:predicted PurR-regulated permease PerM
MKNLNNLFLLSLLLLVGLGIYGIFKPFLISIFMAFILSQLFKSWYDKILRLVKKPTLASFITSLLVFLIIFAPLLVVTKLAVSEIINTYQLIDSGDLKNDALTLKDKTLTLAESYALPAGMASPTELIHKINVNNVVKQISSVTTLTAKYIYQGMSQLLFTLFITFFCLYYFFKDNTKLIAKIINLSPLKNSHEKKLLQNFIDISRATLKGSLVIAAIQGFLTTILFIFTGVPSAVLLGIIATLFALIPMVGTAIIWVPAGIIMLLMGNIWQGITILLFGATVISMIDNFLRPQLVGNSTSLHPLIIFLSTLGGISFFGLTGFLLGPVTAVLFLNLLDIYKAEFKNSLKKFNQ